MVFEFDSVDGGGGEKERKGGREGEREREREKRRGGGGMVHFAHPRRNATTPCPVSSSSCPLYCASIS